MDRFTVAELARHYGVAPGTIGRWTSEDSIKGIRNGRHMVYDLGLIQRAYDRRHPALIAA